MPPRLLQSAIDHSHSPDGRAALQELVCARGATHSGVEAQTHKARTQACRPTCARLAYIGLVRILILFTHHAHLLVVGSTKRRLGYVHPHWLLPWSFTVFASICGETHIDGTVGHRRPPRPSAESKQPLTWRQTLAPPDCEPTILQRPSQCQEQGWCFFEVQASPRRL